MAEDPVVRYETGKVVVETALGPVSYFDPALLGSFTGLLAAFALASLVGLISSGSTGSATDRGPGREIGVPAVLLFAAVTTLVICTFVAYLSGVEAGASDYRLFVMGYITVANLLVTGLALAFLAIVWLFICFEVLARFASAARLIFHSIFVGLAYYWVLNVSSMAAVMVEPPLELPPLSIFVMVAAFASIYVVSSVIRLLISRRAAHDPLTWQASLVPALSASSAIVATYLFLLPVGIVGLWLLLLGVERLRDAGYVALLLISCAPTYVILVLVQVCLPVVAKAAKQGRGKRRLRDWLDTRRKKRSPPPPAPADIPPSMSEETPD